MESIAVAKLTSLLSSMFGSKPIAPAEFVPFPDLLKDTEAEDVLDISPTTAIIFFKLVDAGKIPNTILAELNSLLAGWRKKIEA